MSITTVSQQIQEAIESDAELLAYLGGDAEWLYLEVPESFPCVTLGGFSAVNDKPNSFDMVINLWARNLGIQNSLPFYDMADRLLALINGLDIVCSGWISRPTTEHLRAQFNCIVTRPAQ